MGNVIGKVFDEYVSNQVIQRQSVLSSRVFTDNEIKLLNNKSAFLRLASSVDIREDVAN